VAEDAGFLFSLLCRERKLKAETKVRVLGPAAFFGGYGNGSRALANAAVTDIVHANVFFTVRC
jgi:hypothetical protein